MPKIIIVSGWASPKKYLSALSGAFGAGFEVITLSLHELPSLAKECPSSKLSSSMHLSDYALGLRSVICGADEKNFLIGWSTGGLVLLETAAHSQDMIHGMVLISATPRFCEDRNYNAGVSPSVLIAMIRGIQKDKRATLSNFLMNTHKPFTADDASVGKEADEASLISSEELFAGLQYLRDTDLRSSLGDIALPSIVLHGVEDVIVPWQAGRFLAGELPDASFKLIEGVGHDLPKRFPELIAREAQKLLGG
ncbi:MAG: alpha/beta fold hydrolase [Nitrospirae bacterium]|nr:alpha/beta fold hydrolase [Nitrospirota bacterium]